MNAQKYTQKSLEAVQNAQSIATEYGNQQIEQPHLLLALLLDEGGLIPQLLGNMGLTVPSFTAAAKAERRSGAEYRAMTALMAALTRDAARAAVPLRPSACTDVTGFGLIGHAREMAEGAGCTIELWPGRVPIVPQALELARDGIIPAGAYRNLEFAGPEVETAGTFPQAVLDCLYDPQTSGGLLLAIAEERGAELLRRLADTGVTAAAVGRVRPRGPRRIVLKP